MKVTKHFRVLDGGSGTTGMMKKDAVIDGLYRYSLTRIWNESKPRVLFVMLNPSTSDNEKDGYTVKRCMGFAERWGYGSIEIVNLYAYRSKDAMGLNDVDDPIGPRNREYVLAALRQAERVILAWGEEIQSVTHSRDTLLVLEECAEQGQEYYCFGLTKKGNPKLPSKLSYSTELRKVTLHRDGSSVYLNQWGVTGEQANLADDLLTSERDEAVQPPTMYQTLLDFFSEENWPYEEANERIVRCGLIGENSDLKGHAVIHEDRGVIVFYSTFPVKAPELKRVVLAELFTRINCKLHVGCFEMDFNDGDIYYRTSIDVEGDRLSTALVRNVIYTNFHTMDNFIPVVMSVIYGGVKPSEALEKFHEFKPQLPQ